MNVADRGMHIILLYLRMNAYKILSIQMLTKVITSLPINCISLYLILINQKKAVWKITFIIQCFFSTIWLIILGIPYNFFMSANKRVKGPYQFLTTIGILIQLPVCGIKYIFQQIILISMQGMNYKDDSCQIAYSSQEIFMVNSILQLVLLFIYFIYYKKFEKERKKQEISKKLVNLTTTSTKLTSIQYTIKK